jgi:hypothetical protein
MKEIKMKEELDTVFDIQDFNKILASGKQEEEEIKPTEATQEVVESSEQEVENSEQEVVESEEEVENKAISEEETEEIEEGKEQEQEQEQEIKKPKFNSHRDTKAEKQIAKLVRERERLKGQLEATRNQIKQPANQEIFIDLDAPNPLNYANGENDIDFRVDAKLYQRDKQKKNENFKAVQKEVIQKYEDTLELIEMDTERASSGIKTVSPMVIKLIYDSPVSGELWHYLLANSDEAIKIAQMDPIKTALAIGRIEAKLETENKEGKEGKEGNKEGSGNKPKKSLPTPPNPVKPTKANTTVQNKNFGFTSY